MSKVMEGVRVLEVAQYTFVPAAGAVLADWGADVIKIEHPVRGDAQRGFLRMGGFEIPPERNTIMEHPNRGKRSVGIDVGTHEGRELIYRIAKTADVFLTNFLPDARQKLKIDLEHIRAVNPKIIYARGSAHGDKGPGRLQGGGGRPRQAAPRAGVADRRAAAFDAGVGLTVCGAVCLPPR